MADAASSMLRPDLSTTKTLIITCAIAVAESLLATIVFPFIFSMVHGFEEVEEQYVGFWAGVISMDVPKHLVTLG